MYIQIYQLHGLIRSANLELGRDEDTGGQIVYIIELANALANLPQVSRVEIVTRLFKDDNYPGYSLPFEQINAKVGIVRVPCGPSKYLKKVELWNHLDEFVNNIYYYIKTDEQVPDVVHSHYGDAGYVCNRISKLLNIPHVFSAHSLGKPKFEELKALYPNNSELDVTYNFSCRIKAEQEIIDTADAIIIFCDQERYDQFAKYNINLQDNRLKVILPGVNTERFKPFWDKSLLKDEKQSKVSAKLSEKINSGLNEPDKPCILMLSRLEAKKNISNMVECYVDNPELQEIANLIICAGKISDKSKLTPQQLSIISNIEKLIQSTNTQGKINLLNEIDYETEVPELYRIVGKKGGVFVDCDTTDPLPLTIIEAALSGIPVVANNTCALLDIISKGKSELLINVRKHNLLASALIKLFSNKDLWEHCSKAGVECILNELAWDLVAEKVLTVYKEVIDNYNKT